ncbi:MAG: hypothetical protein JXA20_04650 [Spirochaetes bacterium]|nr:hypothetical protein [Spirochaetota bacterium]
MNQKRGLLLSILFTVLIAVSLQSDLYPVSTAVKSQEDYIFTLDALRNINIMVENFSEDSIQKKHDQIQALFREASETLYAQNFDGSYQKFRKLKFDLIDLLDTISQKYLDRTKEILDSTQKESFDILIKYSPKNTSFITYFRKPFDPLHDVKVYDATKYHYFHSRVKIATYLRNGYKNYHEALNSFKDPEIEMLRKKKYMTPGSQNFIIERFLTVIENCRQAKQYGIEIHRILNANEFGKSLAEFGISGQSMDPIFDYRIPEQFKIDANDNIGLIHAIELKRLEKRKK